MAMLCESGKKPPRTQVISRSSGSSDRREIQIQWEIKPKLPFSGYVSPDFAPKTDANSSSAVVPDINNNRYSSPKPNRVSAAEASLSQPKLVQVKQELEDVPRFPMLLSAPAKISAWTRRRRRLTNAFAHRTPRTWPMRYGCGGRGCPSFCWGESG